MEEVEVEEEGEGLDLQEVKGGAKTEVEVEEVVTMTTPSIQSSTYLEVSTSTYDTFMFIDRFEIFESSMHYIV